MTTEELKRIVAEMGMNRDDLSKMSGRTIRQANSWMSGAAPVPRSVAINIRALVEDKVDLSWLLGVIREEMAGTSPPVPSTAPETAAAPRR